MIVFCATVTLVPLPLLTSIVTVRLTGMLPVLLAVTVIVTDWPAVVDIVERLAEPTWIDGSGEITVRVMLTSRKMFVVVPLTVIV